MDELIALEEEEKIQNGKQQDTKSHDDLNKLYQVNNLRDASLYIERRFSFFVVRKLISIILTSCSMICLKMTLISRNSCRLPKLESWKFKTGMMWL
jgi:hypothetical protein